MPNQPSSWTRRDFLRTGGLASVGVSAAMGMDSVAPPPGLKHAARHCLLINLVGGPSQLETWDPKPHAPEEIRGPFRSIQTSLPGIQFSEHFPRLAVRADKLAILRSVYHDAAPIHESGQQLLQTGRLSHRGINYPHYGAVLDWLSGPDRLNSASVILPHPLTETGLRVSHGQDAGFLGPVWEPVYDFEADGSMIGRASAFERQRYGSTPFARSCIAARQWIERGARSVTVNMFQSLLNEITWDVHANGRDLPSTLADYRQSLCPQLDQVIAALLDDLSERGLLDETLVVVAGEFGRTPRINRHGGRDHWTACWSLLLAGGGINAGQVIGASDAVAGTPIDRPIELSEVHASVYRALGMDPLRSRMPGPDGKPTTLTTVEPIRELWS